MNNSFSLHFYFKKSRISEKQLPIYMRITVGCERTEISTQRKWDPARWNIEAGRAVGTKEDARALNAYLDTLQVKVYEAQRRLIADGEEMTVDNLRSRVQGRPKKSRMLIEIFREHNAKVAQLVEKEFSEGTLQRYQTAMSHTIAFLEWKYKVKDIEISKLNCEFATEMEFWLKSVRNCGHNTSIKYIANLKKIVNLCLKNGWLEKDPFLGYKMNKREVVREILTQDEIDLMATKQFATSRLSTVRTFSCSAVIRGLLTRT